MRRFVLFILLSALWCACGSGGSVADGGIADSDIDPTDDASTDGGLVPDLSGSTDSDFDGLPNDFETLYGLDPFHDDSDGDGTLDGDEDDDGDGLTALQEWSAWQTDPIERTKPSPNHKDLLVEVDYQVGFAPSQTTVDTFLDAFSEVLVSNPDGNGGINAHIYFDEVDLPASDFAEGSIARRSYFQSHGPTNLGSGIHVPQMVHVMFVRGYGNANVGGQAISAPGESVERTGVMVYSGNLNDLSPVCTSDPYPPGVSAEEAITSTFIHEVGHLLQLGHDTTAGGGVNAYNIMVSSTELGGSCQGLKQRTRGVENPLDVTLGASLLGAPRFSQDAAALMKLTNKLSVETSEFEVAGGYTM